MSESVNSLIDVPIQWASRHHWQPGQTLRRFASQSHSLWMIQEGSVEIESEGHLWQLNTGELFLWPRQIPRDIRALEEVRWLSLGWRPMLFQHIDLLEILHLPHQCLPDEDFRLTMGQWMDFLIQILEKRSSPGAIVFLHPGVFHKYAEQRLQARARRSEADLLVWEGLGRALLGLCWPLLAGEHLSQVVQAHERELPAWLIRVNQLIQINPGITPNELARAVGFSPAHLRRLFHQCLRSSPQEYLQQRRLSQAQHLLRLTSLSIGQIAARTGFASVPHFNRLFKNATGVTPSAFRQQESSFKL